MKLYATRNTSESQLFGAVKFWYGRPEKYQGDWYAEAETMPAGCINLELFKRLFPGVSIRKGQCVEITKGTT